MAVTKKFDIIASNYLRIRDVGRGGMGAVFEAIPLDDPSQKVAIKFISQPGQISHDVLHRFQKEATLMSQLYHPNIITFREFGLIEGDPSVAEEARESGYFIVMELAKGKNLKEVLNSSGNKGMSLEFFFQVGQQVASALDYTHGKDIIHRDIKPQNIVIETVDSEQDAEGKISAKVLDFGVASLGESRNFTGVEKNGFDDFAGTPLYLAPELTKLIDAQADHRVDLYSLGCVLYEILAGRTPFRGNSREELKRLHATTEAVRLEKLRPEIPRFVCDMVHKLLAKYPKDRYQTAFSFYSDLKRAEKLIESLKTGKGVDEASSLLPKLALNDRFKSVAARLQLVGRTDSLQKLTEFYNSVASESARGRISVISGASGVGKSRLMQEVRSYFIERKVRFISGSFTKHESSIPFNALASAFDEYLLKIARTQPLEAQNMQSKFKTILGTHAHKVADVIPSMKNFLEGIPSPDIEDDEYSDYSSFVKSFTDFTRCLMTNDQPVVFLFDDLHHADEKSLHLIDQFFTYNNSQRIYMIVSYQDSQFYKNHQFEEFIGKIARLRRRYQKIELAPLDQSNLKELFSHMLVVDESEIDDNLIDNLYLTTKGNPVYLVEKVRDLVLHGEIRQDGDTREWKYNLEDIIKVDRPLQNIDLALSRITGYSEEERNVLEVAAVAGISFQFETLTLNGKINSMSILHTLKRAQTEGLIERYVEDGDLNFLGASYRFTHRSMRESIYDGIALERRKEIHLAVADRIQDLVENLNTQIIFTLVHHMNNGIIDNSRATIERFYSCLEFNLKAAELSSSQGSFPSAVKYFTNSIHLIENQLWDKVNLKEKVKVYEKLANVQLKQGDFKKAIENLKKILEIAAEIPFADFPRETYMNVMQVYASLHLREGKISQAFEISKEAIQSLTGKQLNLNPISYAKFVLYAILDSLSVRFALFNAPIIDLMKKTISSKQKVKSELTFYALAYEAAKNIDPNLALIVHQRGYEAALKVSGTKGELFDIIVNRAEISSKFRLNKVSRRLYRFADKVSTNLKPRYLAKNISSKALNYSQRVNKTDKILTAFQDRDIFRFFDVPRDSILEARVRGLCAYHALLYCEANRATNHVKRALNSLSTRSFESPYLVMMILFIKLIKGESNTLVNSAESYLSKRKHRNSRKNDPFVFLIHTTITLINGKFDQTRESYLNAVDLLTKDKNRSMYLPHQVDFAALCLMTFPPLFEYATGRALLRKTEIFNAFNSVSRQIRSQYIKNPMMNHLLEGVVLCLKGKKSGIKHLQNVITISQALKQELPKLIASFYLGDSLHGVFGASRGRGELLSGLTVSRKHRLIGITRMIESKLEAAGFDYPRRDNRGGIVKVESRFTNFPTTLAYDYLTKIIPSMGLKHMNFLLNEGMKLFKQHYGGSNIHFILFEDRSNRSDARVVYSHAGAVEDEKLLDFIHPYYDIQMTLFLPCMERNWVIDSDSKQGFSFDEEVYTQLLNPEEAKENMPESDATVVGGSDDATVVGIGEDVTVAENMELSFSDNILTQARSVVEGLTMCCLVPVINGNEVIGLVFVENIGELYQSNSLESRKEIDLWAAQLGFVFGNNHIYARDLPLSHEASFTHKYFQGSCQIEPCSWLNVWQYGRLRKDRESSWYLGLNFGDDSYVLFYCQFIGSSAVRESSSHALWHHLLSLRSQIVAGEKSSIELKTLFQDCAYILQSFKGINILEEISLSISVIKQKEKVVDSGHFGASRPLVLGGENKVKPENEAILRYERGGALYYWQVSASLADYMPLVMTRNVSQLEKAFNQEDFLQVSDLYRYEVPINATNSELHEALERVVGIDLVPRYYVGVVLKRSAQEWENNKQDFDDVG